MGDKNYLHNGTWYQTEEELWVACMLDGMGIAYHHHIAFPRRQLNRDQQQRVWHPDFVFGDLRRWVDPGFYPGSVILGIEVKKTVETYGEDAVSYARGVQQDLGIPVIIINRKRIERYRESSGHLPLKPMARAA